MSHHLNLRCVLRPVPLLQPAKHVSNPAYGVQTLFNQCLFPAWAFAGNHYHCFVGRGDFTRRRERRPAHHACRRVWRVRRVWLGGCHHTSVVWYCMLMSMKESWRRNRLGMASHRDSVTGRHWVMHKSPPFEKPYLRVHIDSICQSAQRTMIV